jgi:hypothetical protein
VSTSVASHPLLLEDTRDTGLSDRDAKATSGVSLPGLTGLQVAAIGLALAGLAALAIGWFGVSDKVEVWEQIPYLISGGLGGAALIGFAIAAFVAHEHAEDRRSSASLEVRIAQLEVDLTALVERRFDELEMAVASELDQIRAIGRSRS